MNLLLAAFSPRGPLGRGGYWARMGCATLVFCVLFHACMFSLMALHPELMVYRLLLGLALLLAGAFVIPSGFLAVLLWFSLGCYADPSCFPHAQAPYTWLCGSLMALSALGMLALNVYGFAQAVRRLRSAGISPWMLLLVLIPGGFIMLVGLYCFPPERAEK